MFRKAVRTRAAFFIFILYIKINCGEGEIRTPEELAPLQLFESCALDQLCHLSKGNVWSDRYTLAFFAIFSKNGSMLDTHGPIVYRLGHLLFKQGSRVRLPVGLLEFQTLLTEFIYSAIFTPSSTCERASQIHKNIRDYLEDICIILSS